jgi:putative membrane protein
MINANERDQNQRGGILMFKQPATKIFILALALSLPSGLAAAADTSKSGSTDTKSSSKSTDAKSSSKLSSDDSNFVKDAAQGGMLEVELGKLAQEKAASEKVKTFGKRMEQDHSKVNDELKKLASDKGVQLSTALDSKHKSKVDKLSKMSGADFDKRYMSDMVSDHKEDVKKFQKEADKGKDPELKQFASQKLPTLKEHLQLAESTDKDVKGSTSSKSTGTSTEKSSGSMSKSSSEKGSSR